MWPHPLSRQCPPSQPVKSSVTLNFLFDSIYNLCSVLKHQANSSQPYTSSGAGYKCNFSGKRHLLFAHARKSLHGGVTKLLQKKGG